MKQILSISLFFFFCSFSLLHAQETIFEEKTTIFKSESSFGIGMHTNGFQLTYRYGKFLTGFTKRIYEIEVANIKHPREIKSIYPFEEDVRGYIYGKLNTFIAVRPSVGFQKIIFPKQSIRGVSITYIAQLGPSLGLAKPVYLNIVESEVFRNRVITKKKYDPEEHTTNNIYGRASFFNGIGETKLYPGLFSKVGLHFDYSTDRETLRSLEVGLQLDAYLKEVPIMAFAENRQFYLNFYLAIFFGNRNLQ